VVWAVASVAVFTGHQADIPRSQGRMINRDIIKARLLLLTQAEYQYIFARRIVDGESAASLARALGYKTSDQVFGAMRRFVRAVTGESFWLITRDREKLNRAVDEFEKQLSGKLA
jgi:hypothetical protein